MAHGGYQGLKRALSLERSGDRAGHHRFRPARPRRRGVSDRHQVEDGARSAGRTEVRHLQRRRGRLGDLRRPHADGGRSVRPDRGHDHRRHRGRCDAGLHLPARGVPARARRAQDRDRGGAARASYLGADVPGSGKRFELEVRLGAGAYICGEETSMLESLEGKRGEVRVRPPLPAIKGLFGQPTIVNNVVTLASVPLIMVARRGVLRSTSAWASRAARCRMQLAGNIKRGGLIERAFGLTLRELLYDYGGGSATRSADPHGAGGRSARGLHPCIAVRYARWTTRRSPRIGALLGHGGIVVFDDTRRHGAHGALRDGVLRRRVLRQVHAVPHRLDARRGGHRSHHRRRRTASAI